MHRKLKQAGMALSLLGGAYCYVQMMEAGAENFGTQYEKQALSPRVADHQMELSERTKELTGQAASYLLGSFSLLAASGYIGLKLRDETIANHQFEFADEILLIATESKGLADRLFDANRAIMNGVSEYDLAERSKDSVQSFIGNNTQLP